VFHFKKFSIDDSKAAMKIGTDAVLLGAWAPCDNETRILDIGTGSGILALMMAQRNLKTEIDAVEIDPDAAALAHQNILLSPWTDQVHIFNSSIQEFPTGKQPQYSLIISNPPFFINSLKAPDKARNTARHNDTLPLSDLFENTSKQLTENGKAAFIIPADAFENWKQEAAGFNLHPSVVTWVKSSLEHKAHRVLVTFTRRIKQLVPENEFIIYISRSVYSDEYKQLTKEFYLNF
jgi:tRNA1Val (adenine37-N6)-methyltransferase